ncbi:MAG: phosphopantothenoylcysteine decarboxylase [Clostridia bacterium]|nr:phosphopantothenoylcysteine decarboxylase [Clostridia bacterium]
MKEILLGVTGSIAAYKAAELASKLTKKGYSVNVVMTEAAQKFITPLTFETLTKHKVHTQLFDGNFEPNVHHISLAKRTDLALIAPASADMIGKIANGIADDMLSTTMLALKDVPVLICPAMNTAMYENYFVQQNMKKLNEAGCIFLEPTEKLLACGEVGKGALVDIETIAGFVDGMLKNASEHTHDVYANVGKEENSEVHEAAGKADDMAELDLEEIARAEAEKAAENFEKKLPKTIDLSGLEIPED